MFYVLLSSKYTTSDMLRNPLDNKLLIENILSVFNPI
jgi:hypothetical protein